MRKPIAMLGVFVFLGLWIFIAATIGAGITDWPGLAQLGFYIVAGIGWVFPLRPLMAWMNAGPAKGDDEL